MNIEATRAALIAEARAQFGAAGYAKAELGRIAAAAGVTTGAIYHHFASKAGLFQAVAEDLEMEALEAAAAVEATDPLHRLRLGFDVMLELASRPDVHRILFIEAPQVLGPEAWRAIEHRYALGALRGVLAELAAAGSIPPYPADLLARVLLALLREASADVADGSGDKTTREETRALVSAVFDGLFARR